MPIFTTQLGRVDESDPGKALRSMANHIRYLQKTLEYTLMNLDSSNITEIDTGQTEIKVSGSSGGVFAARGLSFTGEGGESFRAGMVDGVFRFELRGVNGAAMLRMEPGGNLEVSHSAVLQVDGGEW